MHNSINKLYNKSTTNRSKARTPLHRFVVQVEVSIELNDFDLLWICRTTCCTTNLQQVVQQIERRPIQQIRNI